ncbi:multi-sensor hybrid histidine kinase [Candidatus Magnetomorum sp. HK-1]|nr:multi-sensor hybrid histidine kinase [Candidatus Magnetomorum sp. HK-1]
MRSENRIGIRNSIATELLRIVFGLYLVIAIGITLGHMVMEYSYQKKNISSDLEKIQKTFERSIAIEMWQWNQHVLHSTVEGMLEIPVIVGVKLQNMKGKNIAVGGIINHGNKISNVSLQVNLSGITKEEFTINNEEIYRFDVFMHKFKILYPKDNELIPLGEATIYSNSSVIFRTVKLEFLMLIINAVLKTIALWLIFMYFSSLLLRRPLADFISATENVSLENLDTFLVEIKTSDHNELKLLEKSFNSMICNLNESIVERELAEAALQKEKELTEIAFNSLQDTFFLFDVTNGKAIRWNKTFNDISGYTDEEISKMKAPDSYYSPETLKKAMVFIQKVLKERFGIIEMELICKSGRKVPTEYSVSVINDASGNPKYFISIGRDITERKKVEAQLQQSQKMEAIGTLAGGIAHDFNNMLGVITGNLSYALKNFKIKNELYEVLSDIQESSKQAQSLTYQLLTFSKGGTPIKKVSDINKLIKELTIFSIRGTKVNCNFKLLNDLWPAEIDEGQINQVISNLIINANQAMPNGGIITVMTENVTIQAEKELPLSNGPYIKIVVQDQGVGISKKNLSNIFEPYFTTKPKGNGLGLATTYSIIKRHDGHITVYSEMEKGTIFNIYLPASPRDVVVTYDREDAKHVGQGKILIMDDQESILKMVGRMINSMGYKADFAYNGSQAIEMYQEAYNSKLSYDLVILDLTIPGGMGGAKAMQELLKINSHVKAIVSSGYSIDPVMSNYKQYGFCGVIPKPYTKSQLADILNKTLGET